MHVWWIHDLALNCHAPPLLWSEWWCCLADLLPFWAKCLLHFYMDAWKKVTWHWSFIRMPKSGVRCLSGDPKRFLTG